MTLSTHEQKGESSYFARPQLLSSLGNKVVTGGRMDSHQKNKSKLELAAAIEEEVNDIANYLSSE
jgi:hypothetical protein